MKIDLKNIKLTKEQQQNLAAGVLLTALALFGYFKYWYGPLVDKYNEKSKVLEQKKKDLKDARTQVKQYERFQQRKHEITSKIDFINRRFPDKFEISEIISEISRQATMANINIINYEPGKEFNRGTYRENELKAVFETNYRDLGNFLTGTGYIERLITPSQVRIFYVEKNPLDITGPGVKNIRVEVVFRIYSYNE